MVDWQKATVELQKKLDPKHVQPPKQFGPKGSYIEGWHAIAEANRIFGFDGWSYEPVDMRVVAQGERLIGREKKPGHAVSYLARVRVTVGGVVRDDYGSGHGYDVDLGLAHESAAKEAITDALKRSLRSFGSVFGLALYDKTRENVGSDEPPAAPAKSSTPPAPKQETAPIIQGSKCPEGVDPDLWQTVMSRVDAGIEAYADLWKNDLTAAERQSLMKHHEKLKGIAERRGVLAA